MEKFGYSTLMCNDETKGKWWYTKLWKSNGPQKIILFLWLVLQGRVLTWDYLQSKGKQGAGYFYLCLQST
jgi:hypothetical protein